MIKQSFLAFILFQTEARTSIAIQMESELVLTNLSNLIRNKPETYME